MPTATKSPPRRDWQAADDKEFKEILARAVLYDQKVDEGERHHEARYGTCPGEPMRVSTVTALALAIPFTGCAGDTPLIDRVLVEGAGFELQSCRDIVGRYNEAKARMEVLEKLKEKSGSAIVNAMAYDNEYAQVRAVRRFAQSAADKKKCDLTRPATAQPEKP